MVPQAFDEGHDDCTLLYAGRSWHPTLGGVVKSGTKPSAKCWQSSSARCCSRCSEGQHQPKILLPLLPMVLRWLQSVSIIRGMGATSPGGLHGLHGLQQPTTSMGLSRFARSLCFLQRVRRTPEPCRELCTHVHWAHEMVEGAAVHVCSGGLEAGSTQGSVGVGGKSSERCLSAVLAASSAV